MRYLGSRCGNGYFGENWKHWRIYQSKIPPVAQPYPSQLPVFNLARFLPLASKGNGLEVFLITNKCLRNLRGRGEKPPCHLSFCGWVGWSQRAPAPGWDNFFPLLCMSHLTIGLQRRAWIGGYMNADTCTKDFMQLIEAKNIVTGW